jgi:hypothetical protein
MDGLMQQDTINYVRFYFLQNMQNMKKPCMTIHRRTMQHESTAELCKAHKKDKAAKKRASDKKRLSKEEGYLGSPTLHYPFS